MKTKSFNTRISLLLSGILLITLLFTSVFAVSVFAEPEGDTSVPKGEETRIDDGESDPAGSDPAESDPAESAPEETEPEAEETEPEAEETEAIEDVVSEFQVKEGSWLNFIATPLGLIMRFFGKLGLPYIITLLFFAIVMKVILFPFGIKQQKNMVKQASLRPKETAIRKKYAGRNDKATQQKVQQEIMDLYQKEGYNPAAGCLPLLIQMPILFALFQVVYNPLRHIVDLSVPVINEIANKLAGMGHAVTGSGNYDLYVLQKLGELDPSEYALIQSKVTALPDKSALPDLNILGIGLAGKPSELGGWYLLIPVLTLVIVYFTTVLTKKFSYQPEMTADAKTSGCIMDWMMPLMSAFFAYTFPAILGIYWMFQNILGVLQQIILKKMYPTPVFSEEDYRQAEKEMFGKTQYKKKPAGGYKRHPNSLHHIDDDDEDEPVPAKKAEKKPSEPKSSNDLIAPAPLKDEDND